MRVVQLYKSYPPVLGGIEKHIQTLAHGLPRYGVEVLVVVCSQDRHGAAWRDGPAMVLRLPRLFQLSSAPVSLAMFWNLRRLEAELLHLHMPYPPGELAAMLSDKPLVTTYHSPVVRQRLLGALTSPITSKVLSRARAVVVSNPITASMVKGRYQMGDKVRVVPFGVDLERFHPASEGEAAGPPRALFVGRFRYYKGLPVLLAALSKVPDLRLTLAGNGPGRGRAELLARQLGLEGRIDFLGDVSEEVLPELYRSHDIFVLPSNSPSETFGIAMLEAMASGLPCISTELGTGTSWLNRHRETGLVVPPNDPDALAQALQALAADRKLRRTLGRAARKRAEAFGLRTMLEAVVKIYREACG